MRVRCQGLDTLGMAVTICPSYASMRSQSRRDTENRLAGFTCFCTGCGRQANVVDGNGYFLVECGADGCPRLPTDLYKRMEDAVAAWERK